MLKAAGLIVSAIVLLQGCSGSSIKEQNQANVTSNPSGATVYANLLEIGKTPLRQNLYDVFPAGWQNATYQAQGVLSVKKDGCKDFTLKVSDYILSKPIHAELKCNSVTQSVKSSPEIKGVTPVTQNTPIGGTGKRLNELEALYKKGVITKDEYTTTRERILNEL
jgi:hypothetical protein